jgi:glycosyltransferase involved in cell wall biosynthesis
MQVLRQQGALGFARRKAAGAIKQLAKRVRVGWLSRRPWRHDGRPVFLLVSHNCGGGTHRHVTELTAALRGAGVRPVLVRPLRPDRLLWEESDDLGRLVWCRKSTHERESIERQLNLLRPKHAHVHHLLGVPDLLLDRLAAHGIAYDWTIHDYYTICPRVNLLNSEHVYCQEPDARCCDACLAKSGDDQGRPVAESITAWRARFSGRLSRARRVFVPSQDARRRLARYFPDLNPLVRPHPESFPSLLSLAIPWRPGEEVRVAVIGTIVPAKGSKRLLACARDARHRRLPLAFYVLGATDRDAALARIGNVRVSGAYREADVYRRLAQARCHLVFLPSPWPETFMYTLSIAMAARMFVVCFDLGAQAERLRTSGSGLILPVSAAPESINDALLAAASSLAARPVAPPPPAAVSYAEILTSYYDFAADELSRFQASTPGEAAISGADPKTARRSDHARLY